jgi:hypothetical protein
VPKFFAGKFSVQTLLLALIASLQRSQFEFFDTFLVSSAGFVRWQKRVF